jgi:PrtD family type I secretion system ABC transporter
MQQKDENLLWGEMRKFLPAFGSLAFFSFILALMYLVPSIFMQQLFERVFQSRSVETLLFLAAIVLFLCAMWTAIEVVRMRALQRMSVALSERINVRVFETLNRRMEVLPSVSRGVVMQDLQTIREFFSGPTLIQLLDLMWVPVIIAACCLYHPLLGLTLGVLTVIVSALAAANQFLVRQDTKRSLVSAVRASEFGRAVMASAEATRVMGMLPALVASWDKRQQVALGWYAEADRRSAIVSNAIKLLRHLYLPIMLTVGTLLYLNEDVGAGVIFAASVLTARAIYPVDGIASNWRQVWNVRLSVSRVELLLQEAAKLSGKVPLTAARGPLVVSRIAAAPHNRSIPVLTDVSFSLQPGQSLGVVGPSGAGKSSLARVLVGAWPLLKGSINLDGNELSHWDQDQLGLQIGYVPQDVELLPATVADNIARFAAADEARDKALHEAIRLSGIQDIIQRLPEGLNTRLGPDGHVLSGGQRQRIALARAVYGNPHLLVLDEPNSNLDAIGEEGLGRTINAMRELGAIVIVVTHRTNILSYCDQVLVLNSGTVHAFGRRESILDRLARVTPNRQITDAKSDAALGATIAA